MQRRQQHYACQLSCTSPVIVMIGVCHCLLQVLPIAPAVLLAPQGHPNVPL